MTEDTSGKDTLRNRIASVLDETISNTTDLDDYGAELEAYADAIIEGLGLTVSIDHMRYVVLSGTFSKVD